MQRRAFRVKPAACAAWLAHMARMKREARDVEIINANADRLNTEALDVLDYQRLP